MKLKELIDVPPIKTVIQLADTFSTSQAKLGELLTTFVVTEEIGFNLQIFFDALQRKQGMGFFLMGHYGTGKSHFLAVLSILLEHNWAWSYLGDDIFRRYSQLKECKFLVVRIPLHLYAANSSLEEIILSCLEAQLSQDTGKEIVIAQESSLLSNFNRYLLPHHSDFYTYTDVDEAGWQGLIKQDPSSACALVSSYLRTLESIPIRLHYERQEAFAKISRCCQTYAYDGVVLFIDELSEFLRSKQSPSSFNEDIRFLQYIGELSEGFPLWIMASLQERIEETGYIHQDLFNRIKDRYPKRLTLSSKHITSLISKRLILSKPDAEGAIKKVYLHLRHNFPGIKISFEDFFRIYPLHPYTLQMLEGLMRLFSHHRGVVDYIHYQIKGDVDRKIQGIMEEESDYLLAPDTIFDHFQTRIREMVETQVYYNIAYKYFSQQLPQIFEDPQAQTLAMRLIKIMILTEISPLEDRHSVRELTEMLLYHVSSLEPGINYDYIREAILERLLSEASYIKSIPAEDVLDTVYYLDLEANANQIINQETKAILKNMDEINAWPEILKQVNLPYLPLSDLLYLRGDKSYIKWQNTTRPGRVYLQDLRGLSLQEVQSLYGSLQTEEIDFIFFIGLPRQVKEQFDYIQQLLQFNQESRMSKLMIIWLPSEVEDKEAIMTCYAHLILAKRLESNPETKELFKILNSILDKELAQVREIVVELYFSGRVFNLEGELKISFKDLGYLPLEKMLSTLLNKPLSEVYPKHCQIMPYTETISQSLLEILWTEFIVPGKITLKQAKETGLEDIMEGVMLPLKVAKRSGNTYLLVVDAVKNEFLKEFLAYLLPGYRLSYQELYLKLRKGSYGLTKHFFILGSSLLVQAGYLTPYYQGRLVYFNSPSRLYSAGVDEWGEGKLIDPDCQLLLPQAEFIFGQTVFIPFNLSLQKQLWETCLKFKHEMMDRIEETKRLINRYQGYSSFERLPLEEIKNQMSELTQLLDEIKTSYDSQQGLERMLVFVKEHPSLQRCFKSVINLSRFLQTDVAEYSRIYNYLTHPRLFIADSSGLKQRHEFLLEGLKGIGEAVLAGEFEGFKTEAYCFLDQFQEEYLDSHHSFYEQDYFDQIKNIKESFEYGLLQKLSQISLVSVDNDLVKIERLISLVPHRCRKDPRSELCFVPICSCGYKLGQGLDAPKVEEITDCLQKGIVEYARALTKGEYREKLEPYIHNLSKLGQQEELNNLNRLLELPVDDPARLITDLRYLLTSELTSQVNKALSGQILIIERNLDQLIERLSHRRFSRVDLISEVQAWIDQGSKVRDDTYIQIKRADDTSGVNLRIKDAIIEEEGSRFKQAFWLTCCLNQHQRAEESLLLKRGYRVNLSRLNELVELSRELLNSGAADEEIREIEKGLDKDGLLAELSVSSLKPAELSSMLEKEAILKFVSQEAARALIKQILSEPELIKEINKPLKQPRSDWPHLRIVADVYQILDLLKETTEVGQVVKEYIQLISPLNFLLEKITSLNFQEELLFKPSLEQLQREVNRVNQDFEHRFMKGQHQIVSTTEFLNRLYQPYRQRYPNLAVYLIIFDGMRWDTWEYLLPLIRENLPGHKLMEVVPIEAVKPTTTPLNRRALLAGRDEGEGEILGERYLFLAAAERIYRREEMISFLREDVPIKVINFNLIDDKLHSANTDLYSLYQGLRLVLKTSVMPYFKELSGGLIFILSDHGFSYHRQSSKPYSHGGESAFESIIPASIWLPEKIL